MASTAEAPVSNGELGTVSPAPPPRSLEEAAAAQMAQLDLEGNKLPPPSSSKTRTNGSASNGSVPESRPSNSRPSTRSSSTGQAITSRTSSSTRSASTSRKSSQQSISPTTSTTPDIKSADEQDCGGDGSLPNVAKVGSKIGSLQNTTYKPTGGNFKVESKKLQWKAESKIGSLNNVKHKPGGGNIKIETQKIDLKVQSKIGSLQNVKHKPGGGDKKIFDDKEYLKQQKLATASATTSKPGSIAGSKGSSMKGSVENLLQE
ncbi:Microtubule-associated protein 2 [Orchesella cincta]|uniref:Microtubule-associated protein n=1 Tax=Orchesella cincta TaxID=48709 RepID=A0A1D2MGQ3_ORCCI|nr:Microtubule-associated protein 2 [Orchesella cincta]